MAYIGQSIKNGTFSVLDTVEKVNSVTWPTKPGA